MSFGVDSNKLKKIIDLYNPNNHAQSLKYMIFLKGQQDLYINLETSPFQGISFNSIQDRKQVFGVNQLSLYKQSYLKSFLYSLQKNYIYMPILLFILCLIGRLINYEYPKINPYMIGVIVVINLIIQSLERIWFIKKSNQTTKVLQQHLITVVRENKIQQIMSNQLLVGDVVQLRQGDIVPADGWIVQSNNLVLSQHYIDSMINVKKQIFKQCLLNIKKKIQQQDPKDKKVQINCDFSPVVIGGSLVKSGDGRMIVLAVGKLSRQGQKIILSQKNFYQNQIKAKLSEIIFKILRTIKKIALIYLFLFIIKVFVLSSFDIKYFLNIKNWKGLLVIPEILFFAMPQGLPIGILFSLWFIKLRCYLKQNIYIYYCQDVTKAAYITSILYDKCLQQGKTIYREWWNQKFHKFNKKIQHSVSLNQENIENGEHIDDEFKKILNKSQLFSLCKQPGQQYFMGNQSSLIKCTRTSYLIFQQKIEDNIFFYICQSQIIKYVMIKDNKGKFITILGLSNTIIEGCSNIMSYKDSQINSLQQQQKIQFLELVYYYNRRMFKTYSLCYIQLNLTQQLQDIIDKLNNKSAIFICILGASGVKQQTQYEVAKKLRDTGIQLMLLSGTSLQEATQRSKLVGINVDEDALCFTGDQFSKIVGPIICTICKKDICLCQKKNQFKIKHFQQYRKINRYFKVLGVADHFHKHSLIVSLRSIGHSTSLLGLVNQDLPALAQSDLSISASKQLQEKGLVDFPENSLANFMNLVIWSRYSHQFIRKYIQLSIPLIIVSTVLLFLGGLICNQVIILPGALLWLFVVINPLLALNLSWQTPDTQLAKQKIVNYNKSSNLLNQSIYKQIVGQSVLQLIILTILILSGHLFIPQVQDSFDQLSTFTWQAKYLKQDRHYITNGLYKNPLFQVRSYQVIQQKYEIFSKHLTIVYNIFVFMQIYNSLNCRKLKDNVMNILQHIQIQNCILFVIINILHIMFMIYFSKHIGLYPYGISIYQWLISFGFAMPVWLAGFVVKLLPYMQQMKNDRIIYVNKSVNLGIKIAIKQNKFSEFESEQQQQFKQQ